VAADLQDVIGAVSRQFLVSLITTGPDAVLLNELAILRIA